MGGAVAVLRAEAGHDLDHPELVELIGLLSAGSAEFRTRWADHDVHRRGPGGVKTPCHPLVGTMTMPCEHFQVSGDPPLCLMTYAPEPGSPAHDALSLLGGPGASPER